MLASHRLTLLFLLIIAAITKAALATTNGSIASTKALVGANSSALIVQSPTPTSIALSSCLPCVIAAVDTGGGSFLSQIYWLNSTISLPLDTKSIFLSEYRNTTVTSASFAYGNINSFSGSILSSQVSSVQNSMMTEANVLNGYSVFPTFILANGTDGAVPGGVTSFAYPTPYAAIAGFMLFTNLPSAGCALDSDEAQNFVADLVISLGGIPENEENSIGLGQVGVQMKSTFYRPFDVGDSSNVVDIFSATFGAFSFDTKSFSKLVASDTSLLDVYPYLASCSYFSLGVGPPVLQLAVTALTATVTTTIKENSPYPTTGPAPGNGVRPSVPAQTTTLPQGSPTPDAPKQGSPNPSPTEGSDPQHGILSVQHSPSQPSVDSNPPIYQAPSPVNDNTGPADHAGVPNQPSNIPQASTTSNAVAAVPKISFAGTVIEPNEASQYNLPNIGAINPGGAAVTTNNIVYSLAPSAIALVSNGVNLPIAPITKNAPAKSSQLGILSFGGTPYTADSSSRFIITGQTLAPAGPVVTISGTPISLAADATAAVIGTSTVPITPGPAIAIPTVAPVLTFAGSSYTADASSAFVIEGQTLTPGASIQVHGTRISYHTSGSEVVIGSSTQSLSLATTTLPAIVAPVFMLDGSIYTADSSNFIIADQTLKPGSVITVSGMPVSYAAGGAAVIIGSSTEPLSIATITPPPLPPAVTAAVLSFAGSTYTASSSSAFLIADQTLTPNGIITVSGTPISYALAGTAVVIGTSTEALSHATITPAAAILTITFNGNTYTADNAYKDFVIDGQTLSPGDVVTVSGTAISYAAAGTDVVVGTSTEAVGIGGLIMSGFGGAGAGAGRTGVVGFTGGAGEGRKWSRVVLGVALGISLLVGI